MENTKMISIIGYERGDLPYYLSTMMKEKRLRVLTIDNSCSHDLFNSLKRDDKDSNYIEYDRAIYMQNVTVDPQETGSLEKFDVVIAYHGMNIDYDLLELSDITVLSLNYEPAVITDIVDFIDMETINNIPKENLFIVYRDKVSGKISEKYILNQLGITGIEQEAVLYFDEGNYEAYINFCYNGFQSTKGISSEFKSLLNTLQSVLIGNSKKKGKRRG